MNLVTVHQGQLIIQEGQLTEREVTIQQLMDEQERMELAAEDQVRAECCTPLTV